MKRIIIDNGHVAASDFVHRVDELFLKEGEWIKDARNQIKRFRYDGQDLCVKKFCKATVFNRLMYSYFRKSKAERSYNVAQELLKKHIDTPEPIAFVEVYNALHYLKYSYFIYRYESIDYRLSEVLNSDVENKQKIVSGFVDFMANSLHPQGVYHKDFNGTNVLIKKQDDYHYKYLLVDLNRIKFGAPINYHRGLRHLQQVCASPFYLTELAKYYARFKNTDEEETIYQLLFVKYLQRTRRRYSKRFLHALKTLF